MHEGLFDLESQTDLPVRLAFAGIWTCCDREGRFKWRPRSLKAVILPYDNVDFSRVLDALASRGFICKYTIDTEDFGFVPSFLDHQIINNREKQSFIPKPPINIDIDASSTRESHGEHAASGEGKGREGNKERKGTGVDITPSEVARGVLCELCISGDKLLRDLSEVCKAEMDKGRKAEELRDAMIASWELFKRLQAGDELEYAWGAEKFFGQGNWKDQKLWPKKKTQGFDNDEWLKNREKRRKEATN